jgi:hypothetical protein
VRLTALFADGFWPAGHRCRAGISGQVAGGSNAEQWAHRTSHNEPAAARDSLRHGNSGLRRRLGEFGGPNSAAERAAKEGFEPMRR